jgi:hypothetical protein
VVVLRIDSRADRKSLLRGALRPRGEDAANEG